MRMRPCELFMNLADLAKQTIEGYIKENRIISIPDDLPKEFLKRKAGTFVTITKQLTTYNKQQLRGCIGTYLPTKKNIAEEVIQNAISAATEDYRFGPVQKNELPQLSYTVYILKKPQKISSEKELNPKKYGIIVKSGIKTGLLLPDLKNIKTAKKQIFYACKKAGIDYQREPIEIYKFEAEKYQEKNQVPSTKPQINPNDQN